VISVASCVALAGACSGAQHGPGGATTPPPAGSGSGSGPGSGSGVVDTQLGCTLHAGDDPAACAARPGGCSMGPPLVCSGVELPPEAYEPDPHQPCRCICEAERQACAEVP